MTARTWAIALVIGVPTGIALGYLAAPLWLGPLLIVLDAVGVI